MQFDCRIAGEQGSEMIIFLHGFPETSHMWLKLMKELETKGFFCVAPNLRGYSKGACPSGKDQYSIDKLSSDVMEISRYFQKPKFHLIGHDWGAAIGWKIVHDYPNKILSWTGISVPHLQAFGEALVKDKQQRKMSEYVRAFQWPNLPEHNIRKNDFNLFRKLWKNSNSEQIEDYLSVFKNKRQLTAALNYYRGNYKLLKMAAKEQILGKIDVSTLFIWGNQDLAIGAVSVREGHQYIRADYEFIELNSGHWLIQTNYQELRDGILKHINRNKIKTKI